ncbi:ROK family transcriptional regulator [Paroceanicella profunda]|uniref:ROK family transcriptional regulator n=1 Tax=Paroceanicella profunda TaxID=2579971 RepID=A0A5B8FYV8_9RHOB|nr:ROK family transcriptional regulator [Paroceanicella profunda]QDL92590.1 ROK family transcriptional regulator [Paroceanicella profunda]
MLKRVDSDWLRDINRRRVLREVRKVRAVARVDIAEATGLSPATVTVVANELIERGLLEEAPAEAEGDRRRGRPRVLLRLAPGALRVAGVKLAEHRISVTIVDFSGETVGESETAVRTRSQPLDALVGLIEDNVRAAAKQARIRPRDLAGIGIALPGYVDAMTGTAWWSPVLAEPEVNLTRLLEGRFPCPVFADNDANIATLAELWFGLGQGVRNFTVVTVEHGVGMGMVLDGRIRRGARGLGAELGHMKVALDGAPCRCGQRGCLEAYVADYALLRRASPILPDIDLADPARRREGLAALTTLAHQGSAEANAIFREAAAMLGLGMANLVNIVDPGMIILSGTRFRNELLFSDIMAKTLKENSIPFGPPGPEIRTHVWGDLLWTRGAAALALEGLFDDTLFGLQSVRGEVQLTGA